MKAIVYTKYESPESSAYILIAVVALGMFFLALGLKNRAAQIATLKKSETG